MSATRPPNAQALGSMPGFTGSSPWPVTHKWPASMTSGALLARLLFVSKQPPPHDSVGRDALCKHCSLFRSGSQFLILCNPQQLSTAKRQAGRERCLLTATNPALLCHRHISL